MLRVEMVGGNYISEAVQVSSESGAGFDTGVHGNVHREFRVRGVHATPAHMSDALNTDGIVPLT